MRVLLTISIVFCFLATACKKVQERPNSEKNFTLYFAERELVIDSTNGNRSWKWSYLDTCLSKVHGSGKAALSSCSNHSTGFVLPLNINAPNSKFYFEKGNKKDSMTIYYHTFYEGSGNEFEMVYSIDSIKTSFPRWTKSCVKDITPYCKNNEAFMSATVY